MENHSMDKGKLIIENEKPKVEESASHYQLSTLNSPLIKQTEVGVIPEGWKKLSLKSIIEGNNLRSGLYKAIGDYGTGEKIIKLGDVFKFDYYDSTYSKRVSLTKEEIEKYHVEIGDIFIALASVKLEGVGKVMLVKSVDPNTVFDHNVALIRPLKIISPTFLHYFLKSNSIRNEVAKLATQVGTTFLKASSILKFTILLPSEKEQKAIAKALSDVDALIEAQEKLIAKKQAIKTATMQQLLTGKKRLGSMENGEWKIDKASMDNGKLIIENENSANSTRMKQTELGEIPEDWEIVRIDSLASITTGDKNTQDKVNDGTYPFFVRSQTIERINSYSFNGEAVLTAGDGVGTGKIFHYINGKFDYHQRVYNIHSFKPKLDGFYFYKYFSSQFYDRIMSMTAKSSVDSVRREMIADMEIALPSPEEQKAIANVLSNMDKEIEALQSRLQKTKSIKQGMMQELLTGKTRLIENG